ncbi:response regulator [Aridibaculum aurantiacum]|uniref:response regulator n=1 Tax=Aridibaculum aurantiacum TaxID=2810307 RepID=UPI001A974F8D|nr:response regulator transcription factor [Aridibaculum aurantiacum]
MTEHTIILADDHQLLLEGIVSVLKDEPGIRVLATVNNGIELLAKVEEAPPTMVVLDLNMPGMDGLESLKRLKHKFPKVKVLVLSNYNQAELIDQVRLLGADGYLVKNSSSIELKEVMKEVLEGNKWFADADDKLPVESVFLDGFLKKHNLTKREVGIIKLICKGMSSKEMASTLFLSELTVKTHRRNLMRKLNISSIAGLIHFAKENDLV